MYLGYNTNGFAHHRLEDAIAILAELGYQGVAITLDHHALNPWDADFSTQLDGVRNLLQRHVLRCVIETGARFLLDPRRKHQPTLLSPEALLRQRRFDFLERAVLMAERLEADAVSFWSGAADSDEPAKTLMNRLVDACHALCDIAVSRHVPLAFEPEPGMFIANMTDFDELFARVDDPQFGLTLDIGHLHCAGEPIAETIGDWSEVLWNVHIEDMRRGVHEHLMFGDGEIDFAAALRALKDVEYQGGVFVELSRHSHDAVEAAGRSLEYLRSVT